jgi:hypothetical protein
MFKFIKYILLVITLPLVAQKDSTKLQINQVEVIKSFEANLEDARKIVVKPVITPQKEFKPTYQYDISIVPIELKYPDPEVKPLAMNPDGPFLVNKGFIHAGYGLLKNPEILAGYHFAQKDRYDAGIQINYESLDNTNKNPYQRYRNTGIDLYGNLLVKENMKIYGKLETDFRKRYFYHTDLGIDTLFNEVQSERTINGYNITAGIANPEPTKYKFNYDLSLALRNMSITNQDARDNGVTVNGKIEKHFNKGTVLSIDGRYDYAAFNGSKEISLSTASLLPLIKTKIKNVIIHGGVSMIYSSDNNSALFPEVMISYGLAGQKLQVFAGVHQDVFTNTFTNVSQRNPYLNTNMDSLQNSVFQEFYGGVKGKFLFLTYQVKGGFKNVSNQMYLLNNQTDLRVFDMVYDDLGIVFVSGNLDFAFSEHVHFGGWLTQNVFNTELQPKAWHIQNLEANAYATADFFNQKLKLKAELFFGNGVDFINKENIITKSNVLFDLNIGAEYNLFNKVSIFARGINLLNNRFERWYGYPSVGINGMIGIKVVF